MDVEIVKGTDESSSKEFMQRCWMMIFGSLVLGVSFTAISYALNKNGRSGLLLGTTLSPCACKSGITV
jgi:hypothetical protein